jgi:hypothetical protein
MITPGDNVVEPASVVSTPEPDDASRVAAAAAALEGGYEDDGPSGEDAGAPVEDGGEGAEAGVGESEPEESEPAESADPEPEPGPDQAKSSWLAEQSRKERRAREKAKEREDAIAAREKAVEEQLAELTDLRGQVGNLRNSFMRDPVGTLKKLGIESGLGDAAQILMAAELGEDPPAEFMDRLRTREVESALEKQKREIDERFEQLKAQQEQAAAQEFQRKYAAGLDNHCKSLGDDMPYIKTWYEVAPEEVVEMMYGGAVELAQENPDGAPAEPAVLAKALNDRLESKLTPILAKLIELELAQGSEDTTPADKARAASPKTLRKAHAARTTKRLPADTEEERRLRALAVLEDPSSFST